MSQNNSLQRFVGWWRDHWLFGAVLLGTVAFLLFRVGYRTFWMDETMVLNYLHFSVKDFLLEYWYHPDNHPPLYYLLVLLVSKVLPWTMLSIRLMSILSGIGCITVVYILSLRVSGEKTTAALAAGFTAFSSYFILIAQMARYHSLAAFVALLALYYFYRVYQEGNAVRAWYGYLIALLLVVYVDYPHAIYIGCATNALYLYALIRRRSVPKFSSWIIGQAAVALASMPVLWLLYNRIVIQGDGGWTDMNLLHNSWLHIAAGMIFHGYVFFFGENIFPWNWPIMFLGSIVFLGFIVGAWQLKRTSRWSDNRWFIIGLSLVLIVMNTFFMNKADARYNFIVYPKFGFVAYPLFVISGVFLISALHSARVRFALFVAWGIVAATGLWHFYRAENYINASYFRTFNAFEFVESHSLPGDLLAITPDASLGTYNMYVSSYFKRLMPLPYERVQTVPAHARVWFFSTGSDGPEETVTPLSRIPVGYTVLEQYDSVPLDPTLVYWKERILHRPSYQYKYTVFLLQKL
jgi:uncharacterized membrane protein